MDLPEETIEWKNSNEGTMKIVRTSNVKQGEDVIGKTEETTVANVTLEDLEKGIETVTDRLIKNKKEKNRIENKIKQLGKIPPKTAEMIRLQKNLNSLQIIAQAEKHKAEIEDLDQQMDIDSEFIDKRTKLIKSRPKE